MGERRVRNAEVMGSNPTISTKKMEYGVSHTPFFCRCIGTFEPILFRQRNRRALRKGELGGIAIRRAKPGSESHHLIIEKDKLNCVIYIFSFTNSFLVM